MNRKLIIGIDVSKLTLDAHIRPTGMSLRVSNNLNGFSKLKAQIPADEEVLVVFEHTGLYSRKLEVFLHKNAIAYCKVPALAIKRSMGTVRGKSDVIDAARIAEYGWLRREQLESTVFLTEELQQLHHLLSMRSKLVKDRAGYLSRVKELKSSTACPLDKLLMTSHKKLITVFTSEIKKIEDKIFQLIEQNAAYKINYELLRSMKGVGKIIAAKMIVTTSNFTKFSNARKFNCYAGLAPFKHQSGTSLNNRGRVSHLANKEIKAMLNLGAFCAIRCDAELKEYYQRRVAEGKPKMACINIIRAKIVARMFAIVKRQQPYKHLLVA